MELPHQALGYDRTITTFAPDGRILQVEYAKQAARSGSPAVGVVYKEGVLIAADRRKLNKLLILESVEKITKVDDHILVAFAGYISDGRVLVERAQVLAQNHRFTFGTPIDLKTLVKEICNMKQIYTQYGGIRPYGVSLMIAGINSNGVPELYVTEPSGVYYQYKAAAIGANENKAWKVLEEGYKDEMDFDSSLELAIKALVSALDKNKIDEERIEVAVVNKDGIRFLDKEEVKVVLDKILGEVKNEGKES